MNLITKSGKKPKPLTADKFYADKDYLSKVKTPTKLTLPDIIILIISACQMEQHGEEHVFAELMPVSMG